MLMWTLRLRVPCFASFRLHRDKLVSGEYRSHLLKEIRLMLLQCESALRTKGELPKPSLLNWWRKSLHSRLDMVSIKILPRVHWSTSQGWIRLAEHVKDAVSKGAKVEVGGAPEDFPGFFYKPTVLSGVTPEMLVANDETFG